MKITCPTSEDHTEFYVIVDVSQEWLVNNAGDFLEEGEFVGTIHGPTPYKEYICAECGDVGIVDTEEE